MSLPDAIKGAISDQKAIAAKTRAQIWFSDGIAARDSGELEKAERCYKQAKFWIGRYKKLAGSE